jgi:hypothetical protein
MINTNLNNLDILDVSQSPICHPETFHRAAKYWGYEYKKTNTQKRPKIVKTSETASIN